MQQLLGYFIVWGQDGTEQLVMVGQEIFKNGQNEVMGFRKLFMLNTLGGEEVQWLATEREFCRKAGTRLRTRGPFVAAGDDVGRLQAHRRDIVATRRSRG